MDNDDAKRGLKVLRGGRDTLIGAASLLEITDQYLKNRGFEVEQGHAANAYERHGIRPLPVAVAMQLLGMATAPPPHGSTAALVIAYYDPAGQPIDYAAARFIGATERKLLVPKGRVPRLYFPVACDWRTLPENAEVQIHESALKAARAAELGAWAVGINGVHGFRSTVHWRTLLEDFDFLFANHPDRKPTIVFDSNWNEDSPEYNAHVAGASMALSGRLRHTYGNPLLGDADPFHVYVRPLPNNPKADGKSWGFDDFTAAATDEQLVEWMSADPLPYDIDGSEAVVAELNTKVAVVRGLGAIAEINPPHTVMSKNVFTGVNYANMFYMDAMGQPKLGPTAWLHSKKANHVQRLAYKPGEDKYKDGEYINLWSGMGVIPEAGDVQPMLDHLDNVLHPAEVAALLDWLAYPLQNLGAKSAVCTVLVGAPGVGKSRLIDLMIAIYGENAGRVSNDNLNSSFNSVLKARQFVAYEEIAQKDSRNSLQIMQKLKGLITEPSVTINQKNVVEYTIENTINFMITTNYIDSLKLDHRDRRFLVLEFMPKVDYTHDAEYWNVLSEWIAGAGPSAWYDYLLNRDLSAYNPHAPALLTEAKEDMYEAGLSYRGQWLNQYIKSDASIDLITANELELLYQRAASTGGEVEAGGVGAMSNAIRAVGLKPAAFGAKLRVGRGGMPMRYYNLKNLPQYKHTDACLAYLRKRGDIIAGGKF